MKNNNYIIKHRKVKLMNKLQYDSFYKFMVSAGLVLITIPLLGLYYLLCNGNKILITKSEYKLLSSSSAQYVEKRDDILLHILDKLPWILLLLICIGVICLVYGIKKWHNIQKEIDEQTKINTKEKKFNLEKMTNSEIKIKNISELKEQEKTKENSFDKKQLTQAIDIKNLCFEFLTKQHSVSYDIQQNVKLGNYSYYDIVAVSKIDNIDYIYEIKYWEHRPNNAIFYSVINRMEDMKEIYEKMTDRCCKPILLIITLKQYKEYVQNYCNKYMNNHSITCDIYIKTEDDLKKALLTNKISNALIHIVTILIIIHYYNLLNLPFIPTQSYRVVLKLYRKLHDLYVRTH